LEPLFHEFLPLLVPLLDAGVDIDMSFFNFSKQFVRFDIPERTLELACDWSRQIIGID